MTVVTGRPEDYPVDKPGGGLSVDVELCAAGRGMRVLSFFHGLNSLGLSVVKSSKLCVPLSEATPSAGSTQVPCDEPTEAPVARNEPSTVTDDKVKDPAGVPVTCDENHSDDGKRRSRDENASEVSFEPKVKIRKTDETQAEPEKQEKTKYHTIRGPEIRNGKPIFTFGNYESYYGSRNEDSRWTVLEGKLTKWLTDGFVLDIGCNTGRLTAAVARSQAWPRSVTGIDVDANLIEKANARNWLSNLNFEAGNFLQKETSPGEEYDLILCLSVTKWIHFQFGDHGVRRLFRKVHRKLKTGGMFCLEYQDLKSYKKKRHLTAAIRENVRVMEFLPDDFPKFLQSLGFHQVEQIEPPKQSDGGFDRPILLFQKKEDTE